MNRLIAFFVTCYPAWFLSILMWCTMAFPCSGLDLPPGVLSGLQSDEFRIREAAQADLLLWARRKPEQTTDILFRISRSHGDPEVRERCLAVLRELVNDQYLKEGEGFLGIRMQDEKTIVPGDHKPRSVIRVIQVVRDSAADQAGVKLNDLIAGLDEKAWHDEIASMPFMNHIRQLKPGHGILLRILRNGEMINLPVKLSRRPLLADNPFLGQRQADIDAAEQAAREAHFRRWLELRKTRD
jgi:hypothetical protein